MVGGHICGTSDELIRAESGADGSAPLSLGDQLCETGSLGRPWEGGGARMSPKPSPRLGLVVPGEGLDVGVALRLPGGTLALLGVELLLLLVCDACLLGLLQCVGALVLLHAVDEQCDQEGRKEGACNPTHDHSYQHPLLLQDAFLGKLSRQDA